MRIALLLAGAAALWGLAAPAHGQTSVFFLHNSTGRNIIVYGDVRAEIAARAGATADIDFWDHDYNWIGLTDPEGRELGYDYGIPDDDTDPAGLHRLWCTDNAARDSILSRYDVILFKSCYTASDIGSDEELQRFKDWYLEMRDVFDGHPDKTFVVMSPPPRHRLATTPDQADRARGFARFLGSAAYLEGHPNIQFFDLFDILAAPDDGSAERNTLRRDYEGDSRTADSHPNTEANLMLGGVLAQAIVDLAATGVPDGKASWGGVRSLYR